MAELKNNNELLAEQLGKGKDKKVFLISTTAITGEDFYAIHFIKESVISSIALNRDTDGAAASTLHTTIPAGTVLFARVTAITLTSGLAVGYNS